MRNINRHFTSLVISFGVLLASVLCLGAPSVLSAEHGVPSHLTSHRDRLVKQKDTYASQLAEHIRCLREDENTLREINSHLTTNSLNKKDSSLSKFERTMCLANHQRNLEILRSNLAGVDRELLYIDARIKHDSAHK